MRLLIGDEDSTSRLLPLIERVADGCFLTSVRSFPYPHWYTWYVVELERLPEDVLPELTRDPRGPALGIDEDLRCFVYEDGKVFSVDAPQGCGPTDWLVEYIYDLLYDEVCRSLMRREDPMSPTNLANLRQGHEESIVSDFFSFEEVLPGLEEFIASQFSDENIELLDATGELPEWADRYLPGLSRPEIRTRHLRVLDELLRVPRCLGPK